MGRQQSFSKLIFLTIFLSFAACKTTKDIRQAVVTPKYKTTQEIEINTVDTILISGTLEYVDKSQLVIMIAGSGPTDRDCNSGMGFKSDAFKMLAASFMTTGVSTYRYDKRGIGKSTKIPEEDMRMEDRADDISAIVDYFQNDFEKIILLGHSEGVLVGSMVAAQHPRVSAFMAVSGTSVSMDKIILEQFEKYPKILPEVKKHIAEINSGEPLSEVHMVLKSLFRTSVRPFMESAFAIDPLVEMQKVAVPTLVINGNCDIQVPIYHAEALHAAAQNSELKIIPAMGHVLKALKEDCGNAREAYSNSELPLNSEFEQCVKAFLAKQ